MSFSSVFHFHSPVSSLWSLVHPLASIPFSLLRLLSSLIVFHHSSIAPLFCSCFKLIAFLSVCSSFISALSSALVLSPSGELCLYFSRLFLQMSDSVSALRLLIHRERKWWGEKAVTRDEAEGEDWEKDWTNGGKGGECFNHSFPQITEQTHSLRRHVPPPSSPTAPSANIILPTKVQIPKQTEQRTVMLIDNQTGRKMESCWSCTNLHIWSGWWAAGQVCLCPPLLVWWATLWSHTPCLGQGAIAYSWERSRHESRSRCQTSCGTRPTSALVINHLLTHWIHRHLVSLKITHRRTNLFLYNGSISEYGVGVELNQQVGGSDAQELRWGDGVWRLWGERTATNIIKEQRWHKASR